MELNVWADLQQYWEKDTTKVTSATNSQNRKSERGGKGIATHNGGSRTIESRERALVKKIYLWYVFFLIDNCKWWCATALRGVLRETHINKMTGKIQDWVTEEVLESVDSDRLTQLSQAGSNDDELSREVMNRIVLSKSFQFISSFIYKFISIQKLTTILIL